MKKIIALLAIASSARAETGIVWTRPDGGVSVTRVAWNDKRRDPNQSDAAYLAQVIQEMREAEAAGTAPSLGSPQVVDLDTLPKPSDRYFREAWEWRADRIGVDRVRAQTVQRKKLHARAADKREKLLRAWNEAQALGDTPRAAQLSAKLSAITSSAIEAVDLSTVSAPTLTDLRGRVPAVLTEPDP